MRTLAAVSAIMAGLRLSVGRRGGRRPERRLGRSIERQPSIKGEKLSRGRQMSEVAGCRYGGLDPCAGRWQPASACPSGGADLSSVSLAALNQMDEGRF